jgi:hypothetical protein
MVTQQKMTIKHIERLAYTDKSTGSNSEAQENAAMICAIFSAATVEA